MHRHLSRIGLSLALALGIGAAQAMSSGARGPYVHVKDAASTGTTADSGVYYEIFVRAFADSNGDGTGDFNGITARLDYLQSLGVSGIWLMPINPSPSYHGYDVTDYYGVNPQYGSMADFERLLSEAHKRHIKIIIDLVINHSSDQHPWFVAAQDPHSKYHDWYSWSKPGTDLHAISATGTPAWHQGAHGQHYLGVFTGAMPDLDYDTPAVRQEMIRLGQFWLKKGVDGFRLDAAQHIYYDFQSQRNDPAVLRKNLAWWTQFRHGIDAVNPQAYVVGEVTRDGPEELAGYLRPLSAVFDFPLAKQLIDSAKNERDDGLGALLQRTETAYRKVSSKPGTDAPFLSNHDQERVISQLDDNAQHMRMAAAMLLTLPGHPFVYYGEELGVQGRKPDEDLREPMRWYRDPQHVDETHWKPLSPGDGPTVSVEAEQQDRGSLLNFYRELIGWRQQISALRDGALHSVDLTQDGVVAWQLDDANSHALVVHNLSGSARTVKMDSATLHRYSSIALSTRTEVALTHGSLNMPPYSTAILQ